MPLPFTSFFFFGASISTYTSIFHFSKIGDYEEFSYFFIQIVFCLRVGLGLGSGWVRLVWIYIGGWGPDRGGGGIGDEP